MSQNKTLVQPQNGAKNLLQVRLLRSETDIQASLELSRLFLQESQYAGWEPNTQERIDYLRTNMLGKPDRFAVLIAYYRERPVGYLECVANRLMFHQQIITSTLGFYVISEIRKTLLGGRVALKLLAAYRNWALNRRAVEMHLYVTSGIRLDKTDRFLRRVGFCQMGGSYSLTLPTKTTPQADPKPESGA